MRLFYLIFLLFMCACSTNVKKITRESNSTNICYEENDCLVLRQEGGNK